MPDVFSTATADIAVGFVQKFSSDSSCMSFLERVCSKMRLTLIKTDESYRMVGNWKTMESTHTLLQAVLYKYGAETGTVLDDALSYPSLGTDAYANDNCQRESVIEPRTRMIQSAESKLDLRKEPRVPSTKITHNKHVPQIFPDSHSPEVNEDTQNVDGKENTDGDGKEAVPPICSEFNEEADVDKEDLAVHADTSTSATKSSENTRKTGHAVASSKCSLNSHQDTMHPTIAAVCDVCGQMFKTKYNLRRHQATHEEPRHRCELCGKVYKDPRQLMKHQLTHQEGYSKPALPCPQCPKTCCDKHTLAIHIRTVHEGQRQMFLCNICGKSFTKDCSRQRHIMRFHSVTNKKGKTDETKTSQKPLECKTITEKFSLSRDELSCSDCSFVASSKSTLSSHREKIHPTIAAACDVCGQVFKSKYDLQRHLAAHEEPRHSCKLCGNVYKTQRQLMKHQQVHQEGYSKPALPCPQCSKTFCNKYLLAVHIRTVHEGQRQMFLCSACGKRFTQKSSMLEHMNTHSGKKPYKCEHCFKAFTHKGALQSHRFIHKDKQFSCPECHKSFRQKSGLSVHARIHEGIRRFQCTKCGRTFNQIGCLKKHEMRHTGERPYGCKLCGRTFIDVSTIRRHLKLSHKIHKDFKTWREDVDFCPFGQGSLASSLDSEHSTNIQEKAPPVSVSGTSLLSVNHSSWCQDGGDFSSSQSKAANTLQNQRAAPALLEQSSGPWLTSPSQPHRDPAPLDPNSMRHQPNITITLASSGPPLPRTRQSVLIPPSFSPATTQSGEQLVVIPSTSNSLADHVVKVSDGTNSVLMPLEQIKVEEGPVF